MFFLYWQNPLKNKIWLPSWRLLALRRSLCNQIQLKQTWFFKPYRCVQGWRISIAKLSSKDKFYYKLLGGMSLQFWGSSFETLKNGEIPNTPSPPPSNANMQLTGLNTKNLGFARAAHFYWKWSLHLITTFLFKLHLITTFLFTIALDHHISIYVCTWSPHFYLSLHLITTFLFTLQKVFRSILLSCTW